MRRFAQLSVLLIAVLVVGRAFASEQSERLYSRGLVEFHAEHYAEALKVFDDAVKADGQDAYALYYRGVTQGRLGNFGAAVKDLQAVAKARPDLEQVPLELGVALVQNGAYKDAVPWLQKAQGIADTDAHASLFLGLAQLRQGELEAARRNFIRAATKDPSLDLSAHYYQGIADFREGKMAEAEAHFTTVRTSNPNSPLGLEAAAFLAKLKEGQGAAAPPYQVWGIVGIEYDSNVALAPSNDVIKSQVGISQQADERLTLEAGGTYAAWRSEHAQFSVSYDFFQSLHLDLDNFNIQDHRPSAQFVVQQGPVQFGLLGRYDYYFLRADSFLQEGTGSPWIIVDEGKTVGRMELSYRMRRRDFFKRPFSPVRDSFNHAAGVRQYFYLGAPEDFVFAGYRFDREDPVNGSATLPGSATNGNSFAYDGHEISVGGGSALPAGLNAELDFVYRRENYARQSRIEAVGAASIDGREDDEEQVVFVLHKELTRQLRLSLAYFGSFNNSNDDRFSYDRHIGSLSMEVRF